MQTILKTSDLKSDAGKVLDAAKTEPQFVVRDGVLFVIQRAPERAFRRAGMSAWEALSGIAGLNVSIPKMNGIVRKIKL